MRKRLLISALLVLLTAPGVISAQVGAGNPLRVHPQKPRYFTDNSGKAIVLSGSHIWNNVQDWGTSQPPAPLSYTAYLDFLDENGFNFTRLWTWHQSKGIEWSTSNLYFDPSPFDRACPATAGTARDGGPKFELLADPIHFNEPYFSRLFDRAQWAANRGIYVSVMLFQGWSINRGSGGGNAWLDHPFHRDNNCSGIDGDPNGNNTGKDIYNSPSQAVKDIQKAYIEKTVLRLNSLDNIIWEICNECPNASAVWQYEMIAKIREVESRPGKKKHLVWMTGSTTFNDAQLGLQAEVVGPGGGEWVNPPMSNVADISILDTDHIWGVGDPVSGFVPRYWPLQAFVRGHHSIYMDPAFGLPLFGPVSPSGVEQARIRRNFGKVLDFAQKLDLLAMEPKADTSICSTGHCLVNEGLEYLVFQPLQDGIFTVKLPPGSYTYEAYDTFSGATETGARNVSVLGNESFDFGGRPVVWLKNTTPPDTTPPTAPGPTTSPDCLYNEGNVCIVDDSSFTIEVAQATDSGSGVARYEVCRSFDTEGFDGCRVFIPTDGSRSIPVTGSHRPDPGKKRLYRFRAVDGEGNIGPWSHYLPVRTILDNTPPSAPGPTTSPDCVTTQGSICMVNDASFRIEVTPATDVGSRVAFYEVCRSHDTVGFDGCRVYIPTDGSRSILVTGSHRPGPGKKRLYRFRAWDFGGNIGPFGHYLPVQTISP